MSGSFTVQRRGPRWPFVLAGVSIAAVVVLVVVLLTRGDPAVRTVSAAVPTSAAPPTTSTATTAPPPTTVTPVASAVPIVTTTAPRPATTRPPATTPVVPTTAADTASRPLETQVGTGDSSATFTVTGRVRLSYGWGEHGTAQGVQTVRTGCTISGVVYGPGDAVIGGFSGTNYAGAGATEVTTNGTGHILVDITADCDDGPLLWSLTAYD